MKVKNELLNGLPLDEGSLEFATCKDDNYL